MVPQKQPESVGRFATLTIPELEQSKAAVLNTLASQHTLGGVTNTPSKGLSPGIAPNLD
jgi:hypothetical protein